MNVSVLGIDLGKNICSIVGLNASGAVILRRRAKRETLIGLAAIDEVASGRLPTSPPTPSPPASATNEPDDQQQYQRADGGVDDRRNNARAKMDAELRKQPTTDEGAYNSNDEIADDPKPGALHDLAGQPSGNEADP
jgi:hypothetical protein